ncbi:MAG TPA: hypothetical protein VIJ51_13795 [Solirubrobacteraceae bacterium]
MPPIVGIGPAASLSGNAAIVAIGALGMAGAYVAVRSGPPPLRLFVLFGSGMLALALIDPLASTWGMLAAAPDGERYFVIPQLAVLATLVWTIGTRRARLLRSGAIAAVAVALLVAMPAGWDYPVFISTDFSTQAERFARAKPGTIAILPLNPLPWHMALVRH